MIVCRVFTLLVLICFTACGVCSSLFPLFRRRYDVNLDGGSSSSSSSVPEKASPTMFHRRDTVYYWYTERTIAGAYPSVQYSRDYNSARVCDTDKIYFVVSAALSTAGTSLGGIAAIMAAAWVYAGYDACLHSFIVFATFISFVCYVVTVALVSYAYTNSNCAGTIHSVTALKNASPKFAIVEGFILLCIAAGGMLIALLLEAMSFCVCTGTDDYYGGGSDRRASRDPSSRRVGDSDSSVVLSNGSVLLVGKPSEHVQRTPTHLSRSRGEGGMSRRSSASSISSVQSSQLSSSSRSSRNSRSSRSTSVSRPSTSASRPSRSGHRRPLQ